MRYRIVAVGALKRGFYQEGCRHYLKRLGAYAKAEVVEVKARPSAAQESAALLAAAQGFVVALDEAGELLSTRQLADKLEALRLGGTSLVSFLIGGAQGHSDALRQAVSALWSLSPLTLPHELARLLLFEQLYRVETLRAGHPYHRA